MWFRNATTTLPAGPTAMSGRSGDSVGSSLTTEVAWLVPNGIVAVPAGLVACEPHDITVLLPSGGTGVPGTTPGAISRSVHATYKFTWFGLSKSGPTAKRGLS